MTLYVQRCFCQVIASFYIFQKVKAVVISYENYSNTDIGIWYNYYFVSISMKSIQIIHDEMEICCKTS